MSTEREQWRDAQTNLINEREDAIRRAVAAENERDALKAELAEARAAIERARAVCDEAQNKAGRSFGAMSISAMSGEPCQATVPVANVLAALDAPQRPEDTRKRPKLITGNGARRDPHATGLIHEDPEDTREETGRG